MRLTAGRLVLDGVTEGGITTGTFRRGAANGRFEMGEEETRAAG